MPRLAKKALNIPGLFSDKRTQYDYVEDAENPGSISCVNVKLPPDYRAEYVDRGGQSKNYIRAFIGDMNIRLFKNRGLFKFRTTNDDAFTIKIVMPNNLSRELAESFIETLKDEHKNKALLISYFNPEITIQINEKKVKNKYQFEKMFNDEGCTFTQVGDYLLLTLPNNYNTTYLHQMESQFDPGPIIRHINAVIKYRLGIDLLHVEASKDSHRKIKISVSEVANAADFLSIIVACLKDHNLIHDYKDSVVKLKDNSQQVSELATTTTTSHAQGQQILVNPDQTEVQNQPEKGRSQKGVVRSGRQIFLINSDIFFDAEAMRLILVLPEKNKKCWHKVQIKRIKNDISANECLKQFTLHLDETRPNVCFITIPNHPEPERLAYVTALFLRERTEENRNALMQMLAQYPQVDNIIDEVSCQPIATTNNKKKIVIEQVNLTYGYSSEENNIRILIPPDCDLTDYYQQFYSALLDLIIEESDLRLDLLYTHITVDDQTLVISNISSDKCHAIWETFLRRFPDLDQTEINYSIEAYSEETGDLNELDVIISYSAENNVFSAYSLIKETGGFDGNIAKYTAKQDSFGDAVVSIMSQVNESSHYQTHIAPPAIEPQSTNPFIYPAYIPYNMFLLGNPHTSTTTAITPTFETGPRR